MREEHAQGANEPASLPAGVAPAPRTSHRDRALHTGAPAAGALGSVAEGANHEAAELLVPSSTAHRTYNGPACHPYDDPRFPPPAPVLHNGAWIDASGAVRPWWSTSSSTSSSNSTSAAAIYA